MLDISKLAEMLETISGPAGPAENCDRCGDPTESPPECLLYTGNVTVRVFICGPCRGLQVRGPRLFWDEGWQALKRRMSGNNPSS